MWKNKHVVVALLVAPILALIAYFGVDAAVSERPHKAVAGTDYPLRVMSSCRYASGECELQNGDVRLQLVLADEAVWVLRSEVPLSGAMMGTASQGQPLPMTPDGPDGTRWQLGVAALPVRPDGSLRLVVALEQSKYFAEFPAAFVAAGR